jgi:hypothetical protein
MIRHRVNHTDTSKNRGYVGIQLLVEREEFITWFIERDFKGCSVDRIDPNGHYELSNMQVIPLAANIRKDKAIATNGKCRCYNCKEWKALKDFAVDKRRANGHSTICRACDNTRTKNVSPEARKRQLERMRAYYHKTKPNREIGG